jgi:hypothetical protein
MFRINKYAFSQFNIFYTFLIDIRKAVFNWTIINGTINKGVRIENDLLILQPFRKENAGTYLCLVHNLDHSQQASKRINVNVESKQKPVLDVSHKITINMMSSGRDQRRGGTVRLNCIVSKACFFSFFPSTPWLFVFKNMFSKIRNKFYKLNLN